jgi:hypothetical protein
MKEGDVDAFFPSCFRCGREDEDDVEMWIIVMPPKPDRGVYCMPCAIELGLVDDVRGLSGD